MANDLGVSPQKLSETVATLREQKGIMQVRLENISESIKDLEASWQSDASQGLKTIAAKMSDRFGELKKEVESFAVFLDQVIVNYEQVEEKTQGELNAIADAFNV